MAEYDLRVDGPTRGGCTREAYAGGGVRAYTGRGVLPKYLQKDETDLSVTPYNGKTDDSAASRQTMLDTAAQYRTQTINTGLPMIPSCKGTCRTSIGCTCKGTQ